MSMQTPASGTIRAALRYPAFRCLLAGLAVSQIGDWLYNLALVTLVYQRTHSAMWAGAAVAARVVPMVTLGPLGGVIADRLDRRRLMVYCDLIRATLMMIMAYAAFAGLPIVVIPLIAAAATAAGSPYLPSAAAVTPQLVPDADLPGANAARSAVTSLGIIIGPAIGGVLLLLGSPALAFAINGVTFSLSALAVPAVNADPRSRIERTPVRAFGLLREVTDGAAVLRAHPRALRLAGADVVCSLVYGMQTVLLIGVASRTGLGMHGYGYLFAAIGVGALVGTTLASRALRCPHPSAVLASALALVGVPMLLLAVVHWGAAALVLAGITGTGAIMVEVLTETSLQRSLPPEVFGRAYGLAIPAAIAGIVVGSLAAPLLISLLGDSGALIACGAAAIGYAAAVSAPRRPSRVLAAQAS